jgi:four helix bundle protein
MKNPKAEIRRPKEGRNPKTEGRRPTRCARATAQREVGRNPEDGAVPKSNLGSWYSLETRACNDLELREGAPAAAPRPLGERTSQFGEAIIRFAKKIPASAVNERLISQLVGAATSIGANYCEADDSVSGREFKVKIGTCRKESKETMFFLRMIASSEPTLATEARILWREAKELNLIFGAIWRK